MTLLEAIEARHSVRHYLDKPIEQEKACMLRKEIDRINAEWGLHMQLVTGEKRAFTGVLSYGKFSGVENYIAVVGPKRDAALDLHAGYCGEQVVLLAQTLGLNTCWVGLTYRKVPQAYTVADGEKLVCVIAIGYGATQGAAHKTKTAAQVSNVSADTPEWFRRGVEAALLAPTAVNQQKFGFFYKAPAGGGKPQVEARRGFSMFGYTEIDLGIAMLHFEIGAGRDNFEYAR